MAELKLAPEIVEMAIGEERIVNFSFAGSEDLATGETISSIATPDVTPVTDPVLTVADNGVSGTTAQVKISGGVAGTKYIVRILATSSSSQKIVGRGRVIVSS